MNYQINAPPRNRTALVFDVETTGLLPQKPRYSTAPIPISAYPHIIQLSFVLYDIINKNIIRSYDSYVKIGNDVVIGEFVSTLTGITNEICNSKGNDIIDVMRAFSRAYAECDVLVAHNIEFDEKMIMIEIERNRPRLLTEGPECLTVFNKIHEQLRGIEQYCTMRKGIALCNIMVESKTPGKPPTAKWPKLAELYAKLFNNETVAGMHNSMVDVLACLRCYMQMRHTHDPGLLSI
jgi:DNA polymerase III epsilon subunit-like protein